MHTQRMHTGNTAEKIKKEALKNFWDLQRFRKEGMLVKSALHRMMEISGEDLVGKIGKYG